MVSAEIHSSTGIEQTSSPRFAVTTVKTDTPLGFVDAGVDG